MSNLEKYINDIDTLYDNTVNNSRELINSNKLIDIIKIMFKKLYLRKRVY